MRRAVVPGVSLALAAVMLLPGCTATRLEAQARLPPPLIEKLPLRVGIHYPEEFRAFVHKETRGTIDYEVTLGPAHVKNLDWLLKAMFREVVPVEDPTRVGGIRPPLVFVLEPEFQEYSFLTPKDVAGEAFIVTIRYLLNLYDGTGGRVDSFTYTGYGRERARTLASKEPLQIATQKAMRDAGAKVAVELTDQESVRLLMRNEGRPFGAPAESGPPGGSPDRPGQEPLPPPLPAGTPQATPPVPAEAPPAAPPPVEVTPAEESPAEEPPAEGSAGEEPPAAEPAGESPPEEEVAPESPPESPPPPPRASTR